ncbi:MAG: CCA tRNA nucleotidyltransferase [Saccharolobus sp.]
MIEEKVLELIKPDEKDKERINKAIEVIKERLKGLDFEIEGSFAKGTWLKQDTDVDIFIFYPKEVGKDYLKRNALNDIVERVKDLNYIIAYAEHPYVIVYVNDIEIDLVPALRVESGDKAITAVDRTPFHTLYINSHLDEKGKDEVRLLKRFMKGINVYGAEIKIQGFSGYVTELLIVYYGSFRKTLMSASKWKPQIRLELVKPAKEFNEPLVIPDPVDPRRNAASAVSLKSIATFSLAARYYLKNPSMEFFFPSKKSEAKIKGDILIVNIQLNEKVPEDIIWGQVKRSINKIKTALSRSGFKIISVEGWENSQKITIAIQLESKNIGKYYLHEGPPFYSERVDEFIDKNENVFIGEDGKLYSIKERKEYNAEEIVKRNIVLKFKYKMEMYWLEKEEDDEQLMKFLRKTPTWLK